MRDYRHFLFYTDHIDADRLFLDADEAHHAATVLRLKRNDCFNATDGFGAIYTCTFASQNKHELTGIITNRAQQPRHPCRLHVLVGLPERALFEALLVDLTALGVQRITPLICAHCQQAWWERDWIKYGDRFKSKMLSAMKQSLYPWLPLLDQPTLFEQACGGISGTTIVADVNGMPFGTALNTFPSGDTSYAAIIGPPGGLTDEELSAATGHGARAVKIAGTRLTTELATVVLSGLVIGALGFWDDGLLSS
jgi:16S rRNA (uracil1498-N3)-methyltransferase